VLKKVCEIPISNKLLATVLSGSFPPASAVLQSVNTPRLSSVVFKQTEINKHITSWIRGYHLLPAIQKQQQEKL
jgi:hypothetical protein